MYQTCSHFLLWIHSIKWIDGINVLMLWILVYSFQIQVSYKITPSFHTWGPQSSPFPCSDLLWDLAYFTVSASNCNSRFFCVLLKQEKPQVWKHISYISTDLKSVHYILYCSFFDHQWTFRREPDFHFLLLSLVSVSSAPNPVGQSSIPTTFLQNIFRRT